MTQYNLDRYDFKKYLLEELPDTRQDQLIFWKNAIPLPIDLVYSIFEKRGVLLGKYLDHIGASYLYAWSLKEKKETLTDTQPSKHNAKQKEELTASFSHYLESSGISGILLLFADRLLLKDYRPEPAAFFNAICHEGKKYSRIYIPAALKTEIAAVFPDFTGFYGKKNGDFFASVIADYLGIYRSGFGDAFVAIFNRLIDFILINATPGQKNYVSTSAFRISTESNSKNPENNNFVRDTIPDGSIWEPLYFNAESTFTLNTNHPFSNFFDDSANHKKLIIQLLTSMARTEDETIKASERKIIEKFRQDISRELRLMIENNR